MKISSVKIYNNAISSYAGKQDWQVKNEDDYVVISKKRRKCENILVSVLLAQITWDLLNFLFKKK